jgi:hypothetical protein
MSDAIFIAGYYRSGTSALAGALARLGVTLHNDAEPNEHNPLGFYEIPELIEFDVAIFNHLGVDWTDLRGLPAGWAERADIAPHLARLDEILRRRFGHEKLWALKHPHLCRLFPLYERAVKQAGHRLHAIHITRDPWSVAASQHTKNGLSRAHAVLLWIDYLITAERHARHLPRSWLTYQSLLKNPVFTLKKIESDLGLDLCNRLPHGLQDAAKSLTGTLNRAKPAPDASLHAPLRDLAIRLWDAVQTPSAQPADWDGFTKDLDAIRGFLNEINQSGGQPFPGFGAQSPLPAAAAELRPAERLDDGARQRLLALREAAPALPGVKVFIAAPPNRAHAIAETLACLQAQWQPADDITIIAADPVEIPGQTIIACGGDAGALTKTLCAAINDSNTTGYIAILNAGDTLAPDATLRFALTAAGSNADMIYCDEIVPTDRADWVRYKPGWDITRLRQAAYIGDWVWYRGNTIQNLGGFDPSLAGAEEYDIQLRLAEADAEVVRLPETLFTRARHSRRDNIPSTIFGARAAAAITAHLARCGIPATVTPRQYLGLFQHERDIPDPGTSIILLCDHADIAMLDGWLKTLLAQAALSGPVILAGAEMPAGTLQYLAEINARADILEGKIIAVPPAPGASLASVLDQAKALVQTKLTAIIDARSLPADPLWQASLRARLCDPAIAIAAARTLVPLARDKSRFSVQGPIIPGADTRLGAGHLADDPGPGGWLAVDQQASAVSPAFIVRTAALAACQFNDLPGDALWIDLCAQIRAAGGIVWTPDVAFVIQGNTARPDFECAYRAGSPAAQTLPWADPCHHPALSLRGDLLAPEQRLGLIRAAPADTNSLLLTGPAESGAALLNAARALRGAAAIEASWAGDHLLTAELGRRAPTPWLRINPQTTTPAFAPAYDAVFTAAPAASAKPAIEAASQIYATSPALAARVKKLLPPGRRVTLWRPALSAAVWQDFTRNTGLNTMPRILWADEGDAPAWWPELMAQTASSLSWIVVEQPGKHYEGAFARLAPPADEHRWAAELAALAPQIYLRPAGAHADADHYLTLIAAAAGCHIIADDRLDMPDSLRATCLPARIAAWQKALRDAVANLTGTLESGAQNRHLALALPSLESSPPAWAGLSLPPQPHLRAAE